MTLFEKCHVTLDWKGASGHFPPAIRASGRVCPFDLPPKHNATI